MKKTKCTACIRVLFSVTIAFTSVLFFSRTVKADGNVEINATNFPDDNFRSYVSDEFDKDNNDYLDSYEIQNVNTIYVESKNISDLKGIELFTGLIALDCSSNLLTTLDLSKNTALISLECYNNQLTTLDVSKNTSLNYLNCNDNQLTTLDVSKNTALKCLYCSFNQLTTLDVSKNTELEFLDCRRNMLSEPPQVGDNVELYYDPQHVAAIDETNFPDENFRAYVSDSFDIDDDGYLDDDEIQNATAINCWNKNISNLKGIEFFNELKSLSCYVNQLTTLDVSKNTALEYLSCDDNQLTTLDVSKNTALEYLFCSNNQLTTLDVSNYTALEYLYCSNNQLTTLDVSKNTALNYLNCYNNQLTTLDVSKNTALKKLNCYNNQLTTLDVSKNTELEFLDCRRNKLSEPPQVGDNVEFYYDPQYVAVINSTNFPDENFRSYVSAEIDYDDNGYLDSDEIQNTTTIDCRNKNISNLKGIEFFNKLKSLSCSENQLTTLDVSKNTALIYLNCNNNQLTTLDVSNNTALEYLYCNNNQLTTLDVSKNTALKDLNCSYNQLTTFDVSKNTALTELYCFYNQLTTLDVSNNTALKFLDCSYNFISAKPKVSDNVEFCFDPQYKPAAIITQPQDYTGIVGDTATFIVEAEGKDLTYKWQTYSNGTWKNSSMPGSKTDTLSVGITASRDGYKFRCVIEDAIGNKVISNTVELHVASAITTQPKDYTGAVGSTATFTVKATGTELKYQWQAYSNDAWKNSSFTGAKTATLSVPVTAARDGYMFRCVVTDNYNQRTTSSIVVLHVAAPVAITTQPKDNTGAVGSNATFTVKATGTGLKYQWQTYTSGKWKNSSLTGSTTATLSVPVTAARDGYKFRCVITDSYNQKAISNSAVLHVTTPVAITTQPKDYTGAVGSTATFKVKATGTGLKYQWQSYKNGKWVNSSLPGYNTATLSVGVTASRDGYKFRCVVTDKYNQTATSKSAVLHVATPVAITSQPKDFTGPVGSTAEFEVKATGTGLKYQWQTYKSGTWKNSSFTGSTTATLSVDVTASRDGYKFRCVITDSLGNTVTSKTATLHVDNTHTSATNVVTVTTPSNLGLIDADEEQAIPEPKETEKIIFDTEDTIESVTTDVTKETEEAAEAEPEPIDNTEALDVAEDNITGLSGSSEDLDDALAVVDKEADTVDTVSAF